MVGETSTSRKSESDLAAEIRAEADKVIALFNAALRGGPESAALYLITRTYHVAFSDNMHVVAVGTNEENARLNGIIAGTHSPWVVPLKSLTCDFSEYLGKYLQSSEKEKVSKLKKDLSDHKKALSATKSIDMKNADYKVLITQSCFDKPNNKIVFEHHGSIADAVKGADEILTRKDTYTHGVDAYDVQVKLGDIYVSLPHKCWTQYTNHCLEDSTRFADKPNRHITK